MVDEELKPIEQRGVLKLVSCSKWSTPIVFVRKANGIVLLCANYSISLNITLEPKFYPLLVLDDISILNSFKCFAVVYLLIKVPHSHENFRPSIYIVGYTTYQTLFSVKTAPTLFEQINDTTILGLCDTSAYLDFIISLAGASRTRHCIIQYIQEHNFRLLAEKYTFFESLLST